MTQIRIFFMKVVNWNLFHFILDYMRLINLFLSLFIKTITRTHGENTKETNLSENNAKRVEFMRLLGFVL